MVPCVKSQKRLGLLKLIEVDLFSSLHFEHFLFLCSTRKKCRWCTWPCKEPYLWPVFMSNKRKMSEEATRSSTPDRIFATVPISPMQTTPNRPVGKSTPPSSSRRPTHSDRFIPSRLTTNLDDAFDILENKLNYRESLQEQNIHESQAIMNNLLRSELLGQTAVVEPIESTSSRSDDAHFQSPLRKESSSMGSANNLFKYKQSSSSLTGFKTSLDSTNSDFDSVPATSSPARRSLSLGGSKPTGPKLLRKIPKAPHRILDAPSLQDDYYLNLLDWSRNNILAVALTNCVYLWSPLTSKVVKLCEYNAETETVSSIAWSVTHPHLISVGTSLGRILIWDTVASTMIRELKKHDARVGALAWNSSLLASGSRDRSIFIQDIRLVVHGGHSANSSNNKSNISTSHSRRHSFGQVSSGSQSALRRTSGVSSVPQETNSSSVTSHLSTPPRPPHTTQTFTSSTTSTVPKPGAFPLFSPESNGNHSHNNHSQGDIISPPVVGDVLSMAEDAQAQMSLFSSTGTRLLAMRGVFSPLPAVPLFPSTGVVTSPSIVLSSPTRAQSYSSLNLSSSAGEGISGIVKELREHRQEVCGLKWSFDEKMLASGGNDNKLFVWDPHQQSSDPLHRFEDHTAAVKAVAWSPHQAGLLASGGGTADKHIRFWNALTGLPLHKIDTGSQVCNLMWSRTVNEVVSTHGYSLNQIIVWKYPSMQKLATLSGHTMRVLYLAMSPDGQTIVTGAGDETLRFWNVFPAPRNRAGLSLGHSALTPSTADVR